MKLRRVLTKSTSGGWILFAALLMASPAHAQTAESRRLAKVTTQLREAVGTRVRVKLSSGRLVDGAVLSVDGTSVRLRDATGTRKIALANVALVIRSPGRRAGKAPHDRTMKISGATTRRLLRPERSNNLALSRRTTRRLLRPPLRRDLALSGSTARRLLKSASRGDLLLTYRRLKVSGARLRNLGLGLSIGGVVITAIGGGLAGAATRTAATRGGIALSAIGGTVILTGLIMLFWGQARHARGIDMENLIRMTE